MTSSLRSRTAVRRMAPHLAVAAAFSLVANLLFLVSPLYMLQVYDRVLASGSMETLIFLTLIAVFLLLIYIAADGGRKRALARAGEALGDELEMATLRMGLTGRSGDGRKTIEATGNLSRVQNLFVQGTIAPIFDLPFAPLFIGILFVIHPVLGVIGLGGAVVIVGLAVLTDKTSRKGTEEASAKDRRAQNHLSHLVRQRAAIVSMGMTGRAVAGWRRLREDSLQTNLRASAPSTFLSATTRSVRQILQIAILGGAAVLAVRGEISAGAIVAGSIIMGRGLAPVDQTVAIWRVVVLGRKAWRDLVRFIDGAPGGDIAAGEEKVTPMPRPAPQLHFEEFAVGVPGTEHPLLPQMSMALRAGSLVALIGPSGSGKTSLLQTVAGAWAPQHGTVRLGGRAMQGWDAGDRGRHVGYLPQHVELLSGTVFKNIARFTEGPEEEVFAAARQVGCHDMILTLPKGYDTRIGEGGAHLSAGQRQAIGLARAFFGGPALLLLDEPTAHLDASLAANLMTSFAAFSRKGAKERALTAIIATHDLRLINAADQIMIIKDRRVTVVPREEYLRRVSDIKRAGAGNAGTPSMVKVSGGAHEEKTS